MGVGFVMGFCNGISLKKRRRGGGAIRRGYDIK